MLRLSLLRPPSDCHMLLGRLRVSQLILLVVRGAFRLQFLVLHLTFLSLRIVCSPVLRDLFSQSRSISAVHAVAWVHCLPLPALCTLAALYGRVPLSHLNACRLHDRSSPSARSLFPAAAIVAAFFLFLMHRHSIIASTEADSFCNSSFASH